MQWTFDFPIITFQVSELHLLWTGFFRQAYVPTSYVGQIGPLFCIVEYYIQRRVLKHPFQNAFERCRNNPRIFQESTQGVETSLHPHVFIKGIVGKMFLYCKQVVVIMGLLTEAHLQALERTSNHSLQVTVNKGIMMMLKNMH